MKMNELTEKVLSIRQPWAWLIVNGYKNIENRTWNTNYRGILYIHTGNNFDSLGYEWVKLNFPNIEMPDLDQFEKGGIIGSVELIDVLPQNSASSSRWYEGNFGFVLTNPKILKFSQSKGKLGIYNHTI